MGSKQEAGQDARTAEGRFPPGVSGNPAGRPPAVRSLREAAGQFPAAVTEALGELLRVAIETPIGGLGVAAAELRAGVSVLTVAAEALRQLAELAAAESGVDSES